MRDILDYLADLLKREEKDHPNLALTAGRLAILIERAYNNQSEDETRIINKLPPDFYQL